MIIVAYDISNDRRRTKLHDRLLDFGVPVQYSVFECPDGREGQLRKAIGQIVQPRDHVRIYRLCDRCAAHTEVLGPGMVPAAAFAEPAMVSVLHRKKRAETTTPARGQAEDPRASDLMADVADMANLRAAFRRVQTNRGCAGVDRVSLRRFERELDFQLDDLRGDLLGGYYRTRPLRRVSIGKPDGGVRRLCIPTVRDRVAQQAVLNVIGPVWDRHFSDASFAYRPGRSVAQAIRRVERLRDQGYWWVLDADLRDFFGTIDHEELMEAFAKHVADPAVCDIVRQWIEARTTDGRTFQPQLRGVPQGGVISPLLSNIYLDVFDRRLDALGFKLVRYADDFVVLCKSREEVEEARRDVESVLADLKVELNEEKTRATSFDEGFEFLGYLMVGGMRLKRRKGERVRVGRLRRG